MRSVHLTEIINYSRYCKINKSDDTSMPCVIFKWCLYEKMTQKQDGSNLDEKISDASRRDGWGVGPTEFFIYLFLIKVQYFFYY